MKIFKFAVIFLCIALCAGFVIIAAMLIKQNMVDMMMKDSVIPVTNNTQYKKATMIYYMPLVTQKIDGGYACIEMMSKFLNGTKNAETEDMLSEKNGGRITTVTTGGFYDEVRKHFPNYKITRYKNIKNSEMLEKIYESLSGNIPVIVSYASKNKKLEPKAMPETTTEAEIDENSTESPNSENSPKWSIHYGVITGVDFPRDKIMINNPYGYSETFTIDEFLKATRYESYENMEFYLKIGFATELFTKNTIYIFEKISVETETEDEDEDEIEDVAEVK